MLITATIVTYWLMSGLHYLMSGENRLEEVHVKEEEPIQEPEEEPQDTTTTTNCGASAYVSRCNNICNSCKYQQFTVVRKGGDKLARAASTYGRVSKGH